MPLLNSVMQALQQRRQKNAEIIKLAERLKQSQKIAKIGSWEYNTTTGEAFCSDQVYEIYQIKPSTSKEILTQQIVELAVEEDRNKLIKYLQKIELGEMLAPIEFRIKPPDGQTRNLRLVTESLINAHSNHKIIAGTVQDITDVELARNEALSRTHELDKFFSVSLDLLCIANPDGTFKRVNKAFEELLGYTEEEILSRPFLDFVHPEDISKTIECMQDLNTGKPTIKFENRYQCKDESYKILSWTATPDEQTGLIYAAARDVTEIRAKQLEIEQIMQALSKGAIVTTTDRKGRILEVNDAFCKISGYSREELLGQTHRLVNSGAHSKEFFAHLWKTIQSGNVWTGLIQNRTKSGSEYFVRSVMAPVQDISGRIYKYLAIRFDVTDQIVSQQRLEEAQKIAKIGSWEFDVLTNNLSWSSEHYRIFEIDEPQPSEKLYSLYRSRIHPEDLALLDSLIANSFKTGEGYTFNHRVILDGGKRIKHVQGIGKIKFDRNGRLIQMYGTCQDISEKVNADKLNELNRIRATHQSKLTSLGEMSAGIAHEINNPLSIIQGSIPLLKKFKNDEEKFYEKVDALQRAVLRISKIVNSLKKYSRLSPQIEMTTLSLKQVVLDAILMSQTKWERERVSIQVHIPSEAMIFGDSGEMEQVFINLITNAVDAIKDKKDKWIRIESELNGSSQNILFTDSGNGIPKEVEDRLFDPFFTTKEVGEGTGLGLSICRGIIENHKGSIFLRHDRPNTCFEIRIPTSPIAVKSAS